MTFTLTLKEALRFKPELWDQMQKQLGYENQEGKSYMERVQGDMSSFTPQAFCKLSRYVKAEGDKGNTTLKLTVNAVNSVAVLDTGAGVSIITKETWVKWGKRASIKTRMGYN